MNSTEYRKERRNKRYRKQYNQMVFIFLLANIENTHKTHLINFAFLINEVKNKEDIRYKLYRLLLYSFSHCFLCMCFIFIGFAVVLLCFPMCYFFSIFHINHLHCDIVNVRNTINDIIWGNLPVIIESLPWLTGNSHISFERMCWKGHRKKKCKKQNRIVLWHSVKRYNFWTN